MLEAATEAGTVGIVEDIHRDPSPGWAGERVVEPGLGNDWEPSIAADPNAPYVYILHNRYGGEDACANGCPDPAMILHVSDDWGDLAARTFPVCACKGSSDGQYDPIIEVVPETGDVYALYLNGYNVVFVKSTDHGRTWSAPVSTYGNVSWNDKPALTSSDYGKHVYATWNGPTGGDPWVSVSHDFGRTWSQVQVVDGDRYYFAYDGTVLSDGTVVLSPRAASTTRDPARARLAASSSTSSSRPTAAPPGATSWSTGCSSDRPATTAGCYADFHSGHSGVSTDRSDRLYYVYDGAEVAGGPQAVCVPHVGRRRPELVGAEAAFRGRRALHGSRDRGDGRRRPPRVVRVAERHQALERLRSKLERRWRHVECAGEDLRRDLRHRLRQRRTASSSSTVTTARSR